MSNDVLGHLSSACGLPQLLEAASHQFGALQRNVGVQADLLEALVGQLVKDEGVSRAETLLESLFIESSLLERAYETARVQFDQR